MSVNVHEMRIIFVYLWQYLDIYYAFFPNKVERIKERVEEKEGIPPQQQRLIYSGKQM